MVFFPIFFFFYCVSAIRGTPARLHTPREIAEVLTQMLAELLSSWHAGCCQVSDAAAVPVPVLLEWTAFCYH
jgi:hypothetical protein